MRIQINWNAVTAVCAIVVALVMASGWHTDGLSEDIRDLRQEMRGELTGIRQEMREGFAGMRQDIKNLRQEMHEGFAETREDIEALQQDVAFIKSRIRADQTTNDNAQRPSGN